MTVSKITPVNNYTGNGSATTFDFDFLIEDESELLVQYTDSDGVQTTLTLDVDYSINEVGNEEGSYITFPLDKSSYGVLTSDEVITLALRLDIEQEKEYANSSKFLNSTLEWSLDYITRILQIMNRYIERCVKIQEGSSDSAEAYFTELLEDIEEIVTAAKSEFESELETYKTQVDSEIAEFESSVNSSVETFEAQVNTTVSEFEETVNTTLADYKTEVDTEIAEFEENVNSTIDTVTQAAENINELEEAIENASQMASNAEESAAAANETLAELQSFYDNAMTNIENLADTSLSNLTQTGEDKLNYNVFCVNTGETDDEGNPAFLSVSDGVLTTSGEFVVTTAAGKTYTVSDTLTLDISDYEDGTYNIYVNPVDLTLSVIDNTLTAGITFPDDAVYGDYLLNKNTL